MKLLKDIATIRAGIPFRGKIEPKASGRFRLVQIRDISEERPLDPEALVRIDAREAREDHILRRGDVLLVARGKRTVAIAFLSDILDAITGSQVFVIRPHRDVSAEYLAFYLNQRPAQQYISESLSGSYISFIPKHALNDLPVIVPSVEVQRKVVAIHQLALKEHDLQGLIKERRKQFTTESLLQVLRRAQNPNLESRT